MQRAIATMVTLAVLAQPAAAVVLGGSVEQQNGNGTFVKLTTDTRFSVGADPFADDNLYAFDAFG